MAPESSYASGSYGHQVNEFKKLVNGLHKNGIAVILDVVYNHTAEGNERGRFIILKVLTIRGIIGFITILTATGTAPAAAMNSARTAKWAANIYWTL